MHLRYKSAQMSPSRQSGHVASIPPHLRHRTPADAPISSLHGRRGGDESLDDTFIAQGDVGIGATIMGRNMFGPIRGTWDAEDWRGWWGDDPPYHHPVFVLTHHGRAPITMQGGTTFNFVSSPSVLHARFVREAVT